MAVRKYEHNHIRIHCCCFLNQQVPMKCSNSWNNTPNLKHKQDILDQTRSEIPFLTTHDCPSSILLDQICSAHQARDKVQPDQAVKVTDDGDAFSGCIPGSHQGQSFHVAITRPGDFPIQEVEAVNGSHGSLQGRETEFCAQ